MYIQTAPTRTHLTPPPPSSPSPQVFWARYQELPDWEKVIKNIERGEQKIQRQADIMAAVRSKLQRYKDPWQELKVGGCLWVGVGGGRGVCVGWGWGVLESWIAQGLCRGGDWLCLLPPSTHPPTHPHLPPPWPALVPVPCPPPARVTHTDCVWSQQGQGIH